MTPNTDQGVTADVTQDDRIAAVDIHNVILHDWFTQHMLDGMEDECYVIQAFARHRLSSTAALEAEIASLKQRLESAERECQSVWRCAIGDVTGALDVLKNRWVNSRRKHEREAGEELNRIASLIWAARSPAASNYDEAAKLGKALIERARTFLQEQEKQNG